MVGVGSALGMRACSSGNGSSSKTTGRGGSCSGTRSKAQGTHTNSSAPAAGRREPPRSSGFYRPSLDPLRTTSSASLSTYKGQWKLTGGRAQPCSTRRSETTGSPDKNDIRPGWGGGTVPPGFPRPIRGAFRFVDVIRWFPLAALAPPPANVHQPSGLRGITRARRRERCGHQAEAAIRRTAHVAHLRPVRDTAEGQRPEPIPA